MIESLTLALCFADETVVSLISGVGTGDVSGANIR